MHENQTVKFVESMHQKWLGFSHGQYTIEQIIQMLDELVDDSDPDNDLPNSVHDFQTAERIRKVLSPSCDERILVVYDDCC